MLCSFWTFWILEVFGAGLWVTCLTFRSLRLELVVKYKIRLSGWRTWGLFFAMWSPFVIYGAFASGFKADGSSPYVDGVLLCQLTTSWQTGYFVLVAIYGAVVIVCSIILRRANSRHLRDYQETTIILIVFAMEFLIFTLVLFFNAQREEWGRLLNSFVVREDLTSTAAAVTTTTILNDADDFGPDRQLLHHDGGASVQMVWVLFSSACCFVVLGLTGSPSFALQPH